MDKNTLESNMNTVEEMLLDEEKLVTYISLSKELCIHVNDSKNLLSKVAAKLKTSQKDTDLNISYIISGLLEKNIGHTTVCSENDLNEVRKMYKLVFFEHIYGIGKGTSSTDNVAFMALNTFEDFPLCTGLIRSKVCEKRATDDILTLKNKSLKSLEQNVTIPLQKKAKTDPKNSTKQLNGDVKKVDKAHETKSEPIIKTEALSPKKDSQTSRSNSKVNGNKSQKGIAGFFGKTSSVSTGKMTKDVKTEIKTIPEAIKAEKKDTKENTVQVEKEKPENESKMTKNAKKQTKEDSLTKIKKNAKVDKKRKRVLQISDSDSDEEKNDPFVSEPAVNDESEDEIPPTPTINTVKVTSNLLNPKKKRKIVDKTYTDEDGYILTKKEEVYESMSETEDNIVIAKENVKTEPENQVKKENRNHIKIESPKKKKTEIKSSNKKKISPPQKGKQSNIMSFFKKT